MRQVRFILMLLAAAPPAAWGQAVDQAAAGTSLGIASVPNLRDLGGYRTKDGTVVRRGILFRSNQLKNVTPADMQKLAALGLRNDFDLRTAGEREAAPDELPPGVNNITVDVLADAQAGLLATELPKAFADPPNSGAILGGGKVEAAMKETYRDMIRLPSAISAYRTLYTTLADSGATPALFHCTAGKDRTGWAAAALLTLLGVPRKTVMQDYLRSNEYTLPYFKKQIDGFAAQGGDPTILPALIGVKAGYLEAAFDEMQKRYGTIDRYFAEGLGIDAAGQKALRDRLLAPGH